MNALNSTIQVKVISQIIDSSGEKTDMTLYTPATYKHEHNKAFLMYEETEVSGMEGVKTLLSYDGKVLQIKRFGHLNSLLRVEVGETYENTYKTQYGLFLMKTTGKKIKWTDSGHLNIEFHYLLEIEGDPNPPSEVHIIIEAERE
jgi:uncharacterized beta-barrel protein YwiB (DUF1934 family)